MALQMAAHDLERERLVEALSEIVAEWSDPAVPGGNYPGFMRQHFPDLPDTFGIQQAKTLLCEPGIRDHHAG